MSLSSVRSIAASYPLVLAVACSFLVAGCQQTTSSSDSAGQPATDAAADRSTWQTLSKFSPLPSAPAGARYQNTCVGKAYILEGSDEAPEKVLSVVYVHDMPDFPLPMFNDPVRKDATTAHLTGCTTQYRVGTDASGKPKYRWDDFSFYYDPTPDGDYANPRSFCGDEEGVIALGGDRLLDQSGQGWGYSEGHHLTEVDRQVEVVGPDGDTVVISPEGSRWAVSWEWFPQDELTEILVYQYDDPSSAPEPLDHRSAADPLF
jgi:hypothetical protein